MFPMRVNSRINANRLISIFFFFFFLPPQLIPHLLKHLKLFQFLAKKNNGRELFLFANLRIRIRSKVSHVRDREYIRVVYNRCQSIKIYFN